MNWDISPILLPVLALLGALGFSVLDPGPRTIALAVLGSGLIAAAETAERLRWHRRWSGGSLGWSLVGALMIGAGAGTISWALVVMATSTTVGGWPFLAIGALGAILATCLLAFPVAAANSRSAAAPLQHGRPHERDTTPVRRARRRRQARSS